MEAANDNPTQYLIERTREVWQPRLRRDLSRDEANLIIANVTGFFDILSEWSRAEIPVPANDNPGGATSENDGGRDDS